MTTQVQPSNAQTKPREAMPNPPPTRLSEKRHRVLFQSLGQMRRHYHGSSAVAKERAFMWAAGAAAGATLFALIYGAIFFLGH